VILYQANAYASSVVELGKYRMLVEEWRKTEKTRTLSSCAVIQAAFDDHVDKQRRALLSLPLRTPLKHNPQDCEISRGRKGHPSGL